MDRLHVDIRKKIGFQYLVELMSANTVYGAQEIKDIKPFLTKEKLQEELEELEKMITLYSDYRKQFDEIERLMMCMKEVRGSVKKAQEASLSDVDFFEIKNFLIQVDKILPLFSQINEVMESSTIVFFHMDRLLKHLDPDGNSIPSFYISEKYSEKLREVRKQKKQVEVALRREVPQEKHERLVRERQKLVAIEEEEEQQIRERLTTYVKEDLEKLVHNTQAVGRLDYLIQKTKLALQIKGVKPTVGGTKLHIRNMRNPEIEKILWKNDKKFAPISIDMKVGVTVLTGANMGGKSVTLRTTVLMIYMALCGFYVSATQATIPMYDFIFMIAEEFQSIRDGLSSFGGEVIKVKQAIEKVDSGFGFYVMDELARGTNPDEGAQIVRAVVKYLEGKQAMTLLATHYDGIAQYANAHYQVYGLKNTNLQVLENEIGGLGEQRGIKVIGKYMDYGIFRVEDQIDCPRDAIHVCQLLGLQSEIMDLIKEE